MKILPNQKRRSSVFSNASTRSSSVGLEHLVPVLHVSKDWEFGEREKKEKGEVLNLNLQKEKTIEENFSEENFEESEQSFEVSEVSDLRDEEPVLGPSKLFHNDGMKNVI